MSTHCHHECCGISRRTFLKVSSATASGLTLLSTPTAYAQTAANQQLPTDNRQLPTVNKPVRVKAAFIYPPTATLREAGYYSWPGSSFNAEQQQQEFTKQITDLAKQTGVTIEIRESAIDDETSAAKFATEAKSAQADGLLLVLFKKGHWNRVKTIMESAELPMVVFAPLGVLLVEHINEVRNTPGVYLASADALDAIADGIKMIRASAVMRQSRILNIDGPEEKRHRVAHLGTEVLTVPHQRFYDAYASMEPDATVKQLAHEYQARAQAIVEPKELDILEAAKAYFVLHTLVEETQADALMMNCLPGLQMPHKHVPPCMGFMTLRDEGIPAGCQSDLDATLTLMLVQNLFGLPGFQQNASMDTEKNLYFGAHCTSPSRMNGPNAPAEPYVLRSHAEAGWGCVPRVLFPTGQEATMALYHSKDQPEMIIYTGHIVDCPEGPSIGGCRTNLHMAINEVTDVRDVKGMHQIVFYGNYGKQLRTFCQLASVPVIT